MQTDYPWTASPLIICAPMRLIALPHLAIETSAAGGLGFIGAGDDLLRLDDFLAEAAELIKTNQPDLQRMREQTGTLPVGVGVLNWAVANDDGLARVVVDAVRKWAPAAVWMFGAERNGDYAALAEQFRGATGGRTKIWIQVGTVADGIEVARRAEPDVLVVQGTDAGGHGLENGAGIITLLPELHDALKAQEDVLHPIHLVAAGGIIEGRGVAAALILGAEGVTLGTRFLASEEATIAEGYRREVVQASDGGSTTRRTKLYDRLRGTTRWPDRYNARAVVNRSYDDAQAGMPLEENTQLYDAAMQEGDAGWGVNGRLTAYAGTGVGLVTNVMKAGDIVRQVRADALRTLQRT